MDTMSFGCFEGILAARMYTIDEDGLMPAAVPGSYGQWTD